MNNKYSLSLGKIAGIQVFIHWSFLILIAWTIYNDVRAGLGIVDMVWSVVFVLAVFLCVTLHEYGHALAARRYGIQTKDITLLPIGGLAKLESIPEKPKEELVVAIAGPLVNVAIVLVLIPLLLLFGSFDAPLSVSNIGKSNFLLMLAAVNVSLVVFNLIPAFPMDGGRIFRALLAFRFERAKATRIAATVGQLLAVGFMILGFYGDPFLIFIGIFIFFSAQSEAKYTETQSILKNATLRNILIKQPPLMAGALTIREAAQQLLAGQNKDFLVIENNQPAGTIGREQIIRAIAELGETATVHQAMDKELLQLDINLSIEAAWREFVLKNKKLALVTDGGQLAGVVDTDNIAEFLMINRAKVK
ncbi:MAG: site-2 protease family protein [Bacteroidota bacterium]